VIALLLAEPIQIEVTQAQHAQSAAEALAPFAWPVVLLVLLVVFHSPIRSFLERVASRATELSIGSWATIKMPGLEQAPDDPAILVLKDLTGTVWQESGSNLLGQFQAARTPEYALVDLREGGEWISSRLFIFAVMLQRMKGLRCIVFVSSTQVQERAFVGCASPETVRWRLAADQPWLEAAFAHAYASITALPQYINRGSIFTDIRGALDPQTAQMVVSNFIGSLKEPAPHAFPSDYVSIHSGDEHATWITSTEVERIIGTGLWTDWVAESVDPSPDAKRLHVREILAKRSPYIAQVRNGAFVSLVSRTALLDEVAERVK
jgi:hypothetical protein